MKTRFGGLLGVLLLALASCTRSLPQPQPTSPPLSPLSPLSPVAAAPALAQNSDVIVYWSLRDSHGPALYASQPDGKNTRRVVGSTGDLELDSGPFSWSASARRLAFAGNKKGRVDIYSVLPDGSGMFTVTGQIPQGGTDPVWIPNGTRLLFACTGISPQICAVNPDGSGIADLTSSTGAQSAVAPSWSPDGGAIAYQSNRSGLPGIHVINPDGSGERRLAAAVSANSQNARPAWSPNGTEILFQSNRDGRWQIYATDPKGNDARNLSASSADDLDAAWSPDGKKIAFRSDRSGDWEIVVMNSDGTGQHSVSAGRAPVSGFAWSPDSVRLAFASTVSGNSEIYIVSAGGGPTTNISNNPAQDSSPVWIGNR